MKRLISIQHLVQFLFEIKGHQNANRITGRVGLRRATTRNPVAVNIERAPNPMMSSGFIRGERARAAVVHATAVAGHGAAPGSEHRLEVRPARWGEWEGCQLLAARADQRDMIEQLCRYIARPAIARLAALVPKPRVRS